VNPHIIYCTRCVSIAVAATARERGQLQFLRIIDGKPYANRRRNLAAVFANARAHRARPRRHVELAAEMIPNHRYSVHATRERALLLFHTNPLLSLRWLFRISIGPWKQSADVAGDMPVGHVKSMQMNRVCVRGGVGGGRGYGRWPLRLPPWYVNNEVHQSTSTRPAGAAV
jgi:hypothetical protein